MRLLLLTPQVPYAPHEGTTKGTTIRNFGLLAGLAVRHEIHLLSFATPDDDPTASQALHDACRSIHTVLQPERTMQERLWTTLTSSLPDMAHRLWSTAYQHKLQELLQEQRFDVVQFEGIEMMPYLTTVQEHAARVAEPPRLVFDDHNAEYVLQKRVFQTDVRLPQRWPGAAYSLIQWLKLRRFEAWACRQVDAVAAVSEADARALHDIVPDVQAAVVPNGVDIGRYSGFAASAGILPPQSLVFTGTMDYRPNVDAVLWFARRVYPLVRQRLPEARFYVVGRRPHPRLEALRPQAGQAATGIEITGSVPDTRPFIAGAALYVVPLRSGGGTRLKVLEAMAMRCPIISTTMGVDGFPVASGRDVLLADEPEAFAQAVVELLGDAQRRSELGQAGYDFAAAHYDWSAIVPLLERLYQG